MRRLLFITLLLIASRAGFAQSGGLTITNNNEVCGVYVFLTAKQPLGPFPSCGLTSNTIYLPPFPSTGYTVTYTSHGAFTSAVGWISTSGPLSTATDFQWQEAEFQFDCPPPPTCSDGGSYVNDQTIGCTTPRRSTLATSGGGCVTNITWRPSIGTTMDDVTVTFN